MYAWKNMRMPAFVLLALTLLLCAACAGGASPTPPAPTQEPAQVEPADIPPAPDTPAPADTPQPSPTSTPLPAGLSRMNPSPRSEVVSALNWDVQVLDSVRGEEAWKALQAPHLFNETAPQGMEYLLLKLHVKSTAPGSEEHRIHPCDFFVTGDSLLQHECAATTVSVSEPAPALYGGLFTGGQAEGWAAYLVNQGEKSLVLIVGGMSNFDESTYRYIALDETVSLGISPALAGIAPNLAGMERSSPASRSEKIITENWELSLLEVVRGDEAWTMVKNAADFNTPPAEGMEYIAVRIHARNIGTEDHAGRIDTFSFKSTGSANVLYDNPMVILGPRPRLSMAVYPGGEVEGWIVVQAARAETGTMLVYRSTQLADITYPSPRYISLEP